MALEAEAAALACSRRSPRQLQQLSGCVEQMGADGVRHRNVRRHVWTRVIHRPPLPMLYFTSDTHFGDPRVLRIDRRPFATVAEHDEALVANWNAVVGAGDEVWHLGDFARGDARRVADLLAQLNGQKHLIVGNNDGEATIGAAGWASVQHYAELRLEGKLVVLCHYPFRTWNQMGKGALDFHGHSHGRLTPAPRQFDVGVDAQALRPVSFAEVTARRSRR